MCKHEHHRANVRRAVGRKAIYIDEMYERYARERKAGIYETVRANLVWRSVVRWEVDRHKRDQKS